MPPLPDPTDDDAVIEFAASFDGYKVFGQACGDRANARIRQTLDDLRNEMFFEARRRNHNGSNDIFRIYEELVPYFKKYAPFNFDHKLATKVRSEASWGLVAANPSKS